VLGVDGCWCVHVLGFRINYQKWKKIKIKKINSWNIPVIDGNLTKINQKLIIS